MTARVRLLSGPGSLRGSSRCGQLAGPSFQACIEREKLSNQHMPGWAEKVDRFSMRGNAERSNLHFVAFFRKNCLLNIIEMFQHTRARLLRIARNDRGDDALVLPG